MSNSWDYDIPNIWKVTKNVPVTTSQIPGNQMWLAGKSLKNWSFWCENRHIWFTEGMARLRSVTTRLSSLPKYLIDFPWIPIDLLMDWRYLIWIQINSWLVVFRIPLWKIMEFVSWDDDYSQYMESHKIPWFHYWLLYPIISH